MCALLSKRRAVPGARWLMGPSEPKVGGTAWTLPPVLSLSLRGVVMGLGLPERVQRWARGGSHS